MRPAEPVAGHFVPIQGEDVDAAGAFEVEHLGDAITALAEEVEHVDLGVVRVVGDEALVEHRGGAVGFDEVEPVARSVEAQKLALPHDPAVRHASEQLHPALALGQRDDRALGGAELEAVADGDRRARSPGQVLRLHHHGCGLGRRGEQQPENAGCGDGKPGAHDVLPVSVTVVSPR